MKKNLPSFTSIGCYTIIYVTKNNDCLCGDCATSWDKDNEWNPVKTSSTYDEGPDMECNGCANMIESSYGEVCQ